MKKDKTEKQLFHLIQGDKAMEPKTEIEDRLMYTFLLKNVQSEIRQNSFSGFFGWMFSFKSLGIKTAVVSILLLVTFFNTNLEQSNYKQNSCDSLFIEKALVLDSAGIIHDCNKNDSLF